MLKTWRGPLLHVSVKKPSSKNSSANPVIPLSLSLSLSLVPSSHTLLSALVCILRNEKLLFFWGYPLRERMAGKKKKKKKKINIWSTQLFCTPLNVNEVEALITAATANKHDAPLTHPQRGEGNRTSVKKREINGFAWLKRFDSAENSAIFVILMIVSVNNPIKREFVPTSWKKQNTERERKILKKNRQ